MSSWKELDNIVLIRDIPSHHLSKGDVGTIVQVLDERTVEVEFIDENGETKALLPLLISDIIRLNLKLTPA